MIVVDASVLIEVLLRTAAAPDIERRLLDAGASLCAPQVLDLEVAQALRRYCASGDVNASRGQEALDDLIDLPIARYGHVSLLPRIWSLRQDMTTYDAAYVALAETLDVPLVTRDRHLAAAPGHAAIIEVL
jgi:predicted nucleic acid-binding protein